MTELARGGRFRAAGRILRREGGVLYERAGTPAGRRAGDSRRPATRWKTGRFSSTSAIALGVPFDYTDGAHVRADIAARFPDEPGLQGLTMLAFSRPMTARTWLQASNPSERWKWDFMYQDLPPVKGERRSDALPLPPGVIPLKRSECDAVQGTDAAECARRPRSCSVGCSSASLVARAAAHSAPAQRRGDAARRTRRRHAGQTVHVALQVSLPEGLHTQSNKPRDPTLIPTVLDGRRAGGRDGERNRLSARPTDLKQPAPDQPLARVRADVRHRRRLTLARACAPATIAVPASCATRPATRRCAISPTTRRNAGGPLQVVGAATRCRPARHDPLFDGDRSSAHGETPRRRRQPQRCACRQRRAGPAPRNDVATLDAFTVAGTTFGYLGSERFPEVHPQRGERRRKSAACSRPRPARDSVDRPPRRPGAQSDALRAADDPDQPRHHRRRRAGGSRARGFLLGSAYGGAMAVVYGVLGLIVILTAGTFGTINSSPWFNLGIAVLFVVLGLAMFDVIIIDFSQFSEHAAAPARSRGTFVARVHDGRGRRAARRRVRRAGRDPGRAVLEQPLRDRHAASRSHCRSASASAWRFRGRLPAPGSRRCRSRARGWSASNRRSASLFSPPPLTTATRRTVFRESLGRPVSGHIERRGAAESGLARVARRGPRGRSAREQAGADRHVGHLVQELPDDGQDDAGRSRSCRRRSPAT